MRRQYSIRLAVGLAGWFAQPSTPALAGRLGLHIGPPGVGDGGTNPVSIPPISPVDWEIDYVTDQNWETNVAIAPGITFGRRAPISNVVYVSFGGGLIIDANGQGPGVYAAFGLNHGWFNAEMTQALGFALVGDTLVSPYAVRVGMTFSL